MVLISKKINDNNKITKIGNIIKLFNIISISNIINNINKMCIFNNNILLLLLIIINIKPISSILSKQIKSKKILNDNQIIIEIYGEGNQRILSDQAVFPDQMILNNGSVLNDRFLSSSSEEWHQITIKWNSPLETCNSMFKDAQKIIKINFTNFDSSHVTDMSDMFHSCYSLTSIIFANINTKSLTDIRYMFYECTELISLDLRNFDTSLVTSMYQMFLYCKKLQSVDLRSFNTSSVTNMTQMFINCFQLKSLDLVNFDTSSVTTMYQMFLGCESLESLNLRSFKTQKVTSMFQMFYNCSSLKSLDLSSFDTSSVTEMFQMFFGCANLTSLNLRNFNTSKVTTMLEMFRGCASLEFLDVSSFNTSLIEYMGNMFYDCSKLSSLNLSNFDTSRVTAMENMFLGCKQLEILDITNFDTSSVYNIANMFLDCQKIKSIDISHFNTSKVVNMNGIFLNCMELTSLELGKMDTSSVTDMNRMFCNCFKLKSLNLYSFNTINVDVNLINDEIFYGISNLNYCINEDIKEEIKSQLASFTKMNCSNLCYSYQQKKFNLATNKCINNCDDDINNSYEYENTCYGSCPEGTHLIENNKCEQDLICQNYYNYEKTGCLDSIPLGYYLNDSTSRTIDKCDIKCSNCTKDSIENHLCLSCNNSAKYYAKYNDSENVNTFVNCYNEDQVGYYLDFSEKKYKPCYFTCKTCVGEGNEENNNCSECNSNYILNSSNNNCEMPKVDTTIIDSYSSNIISDTDLTTDSNIITYIDSTINDNYGLTDAYWTIFDNYNTISDMDSIIPISEMNINNDTENLDNLYTNSYSYELNSNLTELKEKYLNVTFIYFSEEDMDYIYKIYNLNKEKDKIIVIICDQNPTDTRTATSDYKYRLILENKTELNLSLIGEDFSVDFYVPITNLDLANYNYSKHFESQGFDIYNISSDFYNDFCSPAFIDENDLTLKDRIQYIYPNNVTLCKDNCNYNGAEIENERIICSCNLNSNGELVEKEEDEVEFLDEDDGNFLTYFLDKVNYNIFKCYQLLYSFDNLKNNFAFYAILGIFLVILVLNLIFGFYSLPKLKLLMFNKIPTEKNVRKEVIKELKKIRKSSRRILHNPNKKKKSLKSKLKNDKIKIEIKRVVKRNLSSYIDFKNITIQKPIFRNKNKSKSSKIIKYNKKKIDKSQSREILLKSSDKLGKYKDKMIIDKNDDINELPYTRALRIDKRNIFQIFCSIIIEKLEIINLVYGKHKVKIMVVSEYILFFLFNFFFNALLYSDEVVSNKYHNNGRLDIFVTIVISLLSNIITSIICYYINYSKGIEERWELISELKVEYYYLLNVNIFFRYLKLKFIGFFICEIILISGCFYYIVIFCIVYNKSRGSLVVNYLSSLLEELITSFAITAIILVTRKIGLACLNRHLYNTSKYINNRF